MSLKKEWIKTVVFDSMIIVLAIVLFFTIIPPPQKYQNITSEGIAREGFDYYYSLTQPSNDSILLYEHKPNTSIIYHGTDITINSEGLRDKFYNYEKESGTFRIAAVGDSTTFGFLLNASDSYPKILENKLNNDSNQEKFKKYEVINFGILGYGTTEEAELIKTKVMEYRPDMIILGYTLDDPVISPNPYLAEKTNGSCFLYGTDIKVSCMVNKFIFSSKMSTFILGKMSDVYFSIFDYYKILYGSKRKWENVVNGFSDISKVSKQNNIPIVVVIFPLMENMSNYKWESIHIMVEQEAEKEGFYVVDLLDYYKKYELPQLTLDELHTNKFGNEIAADAIYKKMKGKNITEKNNQIV